MLFLQLSQVEATDHGKAARTLWRAQTAFERDEMDAALSLAYITLDLYNQMSDADGRARANVLAGDVLWRLGHHEMSARHYEGASAQFEKLAERVETLIKLGEVRITQGKHDAAIEAYQKARRLAKGIGDEQLLHTTERLAYLYYEVASWDKAERYYVKTLQLLRRKWSDRNGAVLFELGNTVAQQGRLQEARAFFERSLAHAQVMADLHLQADALHGLAQMSIQAGDRDDASVLLKQSLHLKQQLGEKPCVADALYELSVNEAALGRHEEARTLLEQAAALYEELNAPAAQARAALSQQHVTALPTL